MFFKHSYTQTKSILFCNEKGLRLDRVLSCELQPHKAYNSGGKTLKLGYQYKLYGDPKLYRADFKLDIVAKGKSRLTWIHQDRSSLETYTQPISQVCVGDSLEVSMGLCSLQGFIEELRWDLPMLSDTPRLNSNNYNRDQARRSNVGPDSSLKLYCDLNRICELEDAVVEWYEAVYY